ncbi:MAG TPA: hypothetical protein PLL32_03895 [Anaeromyxobacteraceae bacterium]|nr:hypothetical protein [Anaeromyxobacteraceae bacterium]
MRSLRTSLLAVAAVASLSLPSAARAETYLALKGGVWVPTANEGWSAITGAGSSIASGKMPTSGDVELAYGATLGIIGAQIGAGYMWNTATDAASGAQVKTNGVPFYAVGQLRLPIFFIQPYLELGIGGFANFASAQASLPGGVTSSSATKVSFMAIGGVGVDFLLGPILLGAEGRYLYITEQTFDWGNLKPSGVTITANVGYVF